MSNHKPMDIFSTDMAIPFDVAAYCRGNKLCVETVKLARAIDAKHRALQSVEHAEAVLWNKEAELLEAVAAMRKRMERDPK